MCINTLAGFCTFYCMFEFGFKFYDPVNTAKVISHIVISRISPLISEPVLFAYMFASN